MLVLVTAFTPLAGSVTDQGDGGYDAFVSAKAAGSGLLCASLVAAGGLHATMYTDTEFKQVVGVQSLTSFDYSRASSPFLFPLPDPQDDAMFSIRFAGYYKPTVSCEYLIHSCFGVQVFRFPSRLAGWRSPHVLSGCKCHK